jgi:hypothetical protein
MAKWRRAAFWIMKVTCAKAHCIACALTPTQAGTRTHSRAHTEICKSCISWTRLSVTLYVYCLSCCLLWKKHHWISKHGECNVKIMHIYLTLQSQEKCDRTNLPQNNPYQKILDQSDAYVSAHSVSIQREILRSKCKHLDPVYGIKYFSFGS